MFSGALPEGVGSIQRIPGDTVTVENESKTIYHREFFYTRLGRGEGCYSRVWWAIFRVTRY